MATRHSTTPLEKQGVLAAELTVQISPVMEREFKRRNVFHELRLEKAACIVNGATGVYRVSGDRAKELLADAQAMQGNNRELPRGIPAAYTALRRNIERTLKEGARRGLWNDPGVEEAKRRASDSPACFKVGDRVLWFADDDAYGEDEPYGEEVTIVGGYQMHQVAADDGPYVTSAGERLEYRFGYLIQGEGSSECFTAAYHLTRDDCKPAHLCLVGAGASEGE